MSFEVPTVETVPDVVEEPLDAGTIDRAIAALEASEYAGIPLTPTEVAIHYGLQGSGLLRRTSEAVKRHAPEGLKDRNHLLTIEEKVGRVALGLAESEGRLSATERFEIDATFWSMMEVEDPWQARQFEKGIFSYTDLDLLGRKHIPQVEWLSEADTELFAGMQKMQRNGHRFSFAELNQTPVAVLDKVGDIAVKHKTYLHTWLPQFLRDGIRPVFTEEEEQQHDYDSDLAVIDAFRQRALHIEVEGELDENEQELIDRANRLLSDGLASEYVLQYIMHDHAARETESLRSALPALAAFSSGAWVLQTYGANELIRAFAKVGGSGDDIGLEIKSIPQLKLSHEALKKRLLWFVPLAIGVVAADACVDMVDKKVDPNVGGALYGSGTVAITAGSTAGSLVDHRGRYEELVAEGRVRDEDLETATRAAFRHYIYNDPVRRGAALAIVAGPVVSSAIWPWVENKPFIYVPLGAIETLFAMGGFKYDKVRLPQRLKHYTKKQTAELRAARQPSAI